MRPEGQRLHVRRPLHVRLCPIRTSPIAMICTRPIAIGCCRSHHRRHGAHPWHQEREQDQFEPLVTVSPAGQRDQARRRFHAQKRAGHEKVMENDKGHIDPVHREKIPPRGRKVTRNSPQVLPKIDSWLLRSFKNS